MRTNCLLVSCKSCPSCLSIRLCKSRIRVTVPALLGEKAVITVLEEMIDMARSCAYPNDWPAYKGTIKSLADTWPEYVLEPDHPLTLLTSDMPCSIFGV